MKNNKFNNNKKGYLVDGKWCPFSPSEMAKGKKGEQRAQEHFESLGWQVYDVSDIPEYRQKEIDFILQKDGEVFTVEVKSSTSAAKDRKLVVETFVDISIKKLGWIWTTEADLLAVVSGDKMFIYLPYEMREYITECNKQIVCKQQYGTEFKSNPMYHAFRKRFKDRNSVFGSVSEIFYVEISRYKKCGYHFQEIDLEPTEINF